MIEEIKTLKESYDNGNQDELSNKPPLQIDEIWTKIRPNFPEKRFNDLFLHLEGLKLGSMVFRNRNGGYSLF